MPGPFRDKAPPNPYSVSMRATATLKGSIFRISGDVSRITQPPGGSPLSGIIGATLRVIVRGLGQFIGAATGKPLGGYPSPTQEGGRLPAGGTWRELVPCTRSTTAPHHPSVPCGDRLEPQWDGPQRSPVPARRSPGGPTSSPSGSSGAAAAALSWFSLPFGEEPRPSGLPLPVQMPECGRLPIGLPAHPMDHHGTP